MNDSVFNLFLFVTRNHYVILLLHSCTNIVEEFLDNEETSIRGSFKTHRGRKEAPNQHTKKMRGRGVIGMSQPSRPCLYKYAHIVGNAAVSTRVCS